MRRQLAMLRGSPWEREALVHWFINVFIKLLRSYLCVEITQAWSSGWPPSLHEKGSLLSRAKQRWRRGTGGQDGALVASFSSLGSHSAIPSQVNQQISFLLSQPALPTWRGPPSCVCISTQGRVSWVLLSNTHWSNHCC